MARWRGAIGTVTSLPPVDDFGQLGSAFFSNGLSHRRVDVDGGHGVEIDLSDDLRGPAGSLHGGLVAMLIDVAGASSIAAESGRLVATSSTTIQYLAAGRVGPIRALGRPLRWSDTLGVAEVRVNDVGKDDRLMAVAHVTCVFLDGSSFEPTRR
jgi:uncharacterized protein (TIGR00369 family)